MSAVAWSQHTAAEILEALQTAPAVYGPWVAYETCGITLRKSFLRRALPGQESAGVFSDARGWLADVGEWVGPQLEQIYASGEMPPLLPRGTS